MSNSLLERLGGSAAVRAVVDEFYQRILDDKRLAPFFENTKLAFLKMHQVEFLKVAFTEVPPNVADLLRDKHRKLFSKGLNETHFDLVAKHLEESLRHLKVNEELIQEATDVVLPLRTVFENSQEEKKDSDEESDTIIPTTKMPTLLDRLGGNEAVKAAVNGLYTRLLADPDTAPFFEDSNMARLKVHQIEFMKVAFSQIPDDMDVPAFMKQTHAKLFREKGLNETHFDKVAGHLVAVLQELSVEQHLIDEVVSVLGPLRAAFEDGAREAHPL